MFLYSCEPAAAKVILGRNPLRKPLVPLDSSHMFLLCIAAALWDTSVPAHKNRGKHSAHFRALDPDKSNTPSFVCSSPKKSAAGCYPRTEISKEISLVDNTPRTKAPSTPEHNTDTIRICVGWKSPEFEAFNLFEKQFLALGQKGLSCGVNARILCKGLITAKHQAFASTAKSSSSLQRANCCMQDR